MTTESYPVADALLTIGAVGISRENPITFKSGIVSPVYIDNRRLTYHPDAWHTVIEAMRARISADAIPFEVIAGIETGGIPHSSALAYVLGCPSVWVRKQAKDHGLARRVEGGEVAGKRVLLLEDQITTGGSSLSGVEALRAAGAVVADCLAITGYGFAEADAAFAAAGVRLHILVSFEEMLDAAEKSGKFSSEDVHVIREWLRDPRGWSK